MELGSVDGRPPNAGITASSGKIEVRGLNKYFHVGKSAILVLSSVNLFIPEGEFVTILGPSGCGKTTLIRIVAGLEKPTTGGVLIRQADRHRPANTMIFQENSVFPWLTVRQNVEYGLWVRRVAKKTRAPMVDYFVKKVGLEAFAHYYPYQISGGMKQRVSIARAFANDPEIFLMDEPFASLDEQNRHLLQQELLSIWSETKKTVLFITHSIDEAIVLSDRVIIMTARPGRIKAEVPIDIPRPRSLYDVRASPQYGELTRVFWSLLRDEVSDATESRAHVSPDRNGLR
jgi:NitT/TauT family transport system ATP-binding protein